MSDSPSALRTTPLHATHKAAGAKLVPFAGYDMPVQYKSGVIAETKAVRAQAGLFDASHMGEIWVRGSGALAWLEGLLTNGMHNVADRQARYTLLLTDDGGVVDDLILYRESVTDWLVVCNASNRDAVWNHLNARKPAQNVSLEDVSDATALLALQGPQATAIAAAVLGVAVSDLPKRFRWMRGGGARSSWIMGRTGYTGEDGIEFFVPAQDAVALWQELVRRGAVECGLGARDVCRIEAGLPLYGHEMDLQHGPRGAGLMFAVDMTKPFAGREAVERAPRETLIGIVMEGRGVPREGYEVQRAGQTVGIITSGTHSPHLEKGIAMVRVAEGLKLDEPFEVMIRGTAYRALYHALPFVHRFRKV